MVYAVKVGRKTGKFSTWDACKKQVEGYSGAQYKKFSSEAEADAYLGGYPIPVKSKDTSSARLRPVSLSNKEKKFSDEQILKQANLEKEYAEMCKKVPDGEAFAYVDGSFYKNIKTFGFGCALYTPNDDMEFSGCSNEEHFAEFWNISGECFGAMLALREAVKLGCSKLTIFHDLENIGLWGTGKWQARCLVSILYVEYLEKVRKYMDVEFVWVRGHKDVHNLRADRLASSAIKDKKYFDIMKFFEDAGITVSV